MPGILLLPLAVAGLVWNEVHAVRTARSLAEGTGVVREAVPDRIDPALEGRLVHVAGSLRVPGLLSDPEFAVHAPPGALRLRRFVQTFQWREETSGRASSGTYAYRPVWSEQILDSARFHQPNAAQNPPPRHMPLILAAPEVGLGAFRVPAPLLGALGGDRPLAPPREAAAPGETLDGAALYVGADPAIPRIGDQKITWDVLEAAEASVVAQQRGNGFGPYRAEAGGGVEIIRRGLVPARDMLHQEEDTNAAQAWFARFLGAGMLFLGFGLALPLVPLPVPRGLASAATVARAAFLAGVAAPAVIAVAWVAARVAG